MATRRSLNELAQWAIATILIIVVSCFALGYCGEATNARAVGPADNGQVEELCPFYPGWNLVVLNGTPLDLPSCVEVVWRYEAVEDRWYFWGRDNPKYWNDLGSFDITKGYMLWTARR